MLIAPLAVNHRSVAASVAVFWLNSVDQVVTWCDGYHGWQLLWVRWGSGSLHLNGDLPGVGCLTLKFLVDNVNLFITHLEWTCHVFVLFIVLFCCTVTWTHSQSPCLPSNRHRQSNDDCLEGNRENYQVCSVQFCVQQLCTVQCTHTWTDLTVLWIGFCLTGPISLCLDSFFHPVVSFFLLSFYLFFFPRLISAAVDWMSAILLHMALP